MPCQLCSQELLASKLVLLIVVLQISSTVYKFTVQFHPLQTAMENSSPSMKHWSSFQMVPVLNARFVGKFSATLVTAGSISRIFTIQDRWSAQYAKRFVVVLRSLEITLLIHTRFVRKMWSRSMERCLIRYMYWFCSLNVTFECHSSTCSIKKFRKHLPDTQDSWGEKCCWKIWTFYELDLNIKVRD